MMLLATFPVLPDQASTFEDVLVTLAEIVQKTEPETLEYRLIRNKKDVGEYIVLETYASQEAFEFHRDNPATKPLFGTIQGLLTGKPVFRFFDEIELN